MTGFSDDLLRAAERLYMRRKGQKGPVKSAFVRRSISTIYYALFHFMLEEAALRLVGSGNHLRQRRRLFIRTLSHTGLTTALSKLKAGTVDKSVEDLFRLPATPAGPVPVPPFIRAMATTYLDAKAKREDADYNLNQPFDKADAELLGNRASRAMRTWRSAATAADRDAKHAVAILLSLKGKLRD